MASMYTWMKAVDPSSLIPIPKTTETYSRIKEFGLETVLWEEFSEVRNLSVIFRIEDFIDRNNPCLFIYDPKKESLQKGYLFNVQNFSEVDKWIFDNQRNLDDYTYLITTQISNHGFGFVGTAYSDGRGNLFCETLHKPGVCNQRELSQSENKQITDYEDYFIMGEGELVSLRGSFLTGHDVKEISEKYLDKQGYFEFVKGKQKKIIGIYTTGYEPFRYLVSFPDMLHRELHFSELRLRLNAMAARET